MKKIFILAFIFILGIGVNAQTDSTKIESLTKEVIYKDVKDVIKSLAETLKVGTEHVYGVLVKQQVVHSITRILVYIVIGFFIFLLFFNADKLLKKVGDDKMSSEQDATMGWLMIPGVLLSICLVIYFFFTIDSTVTGFINPEYGAIEKIVEMLK